MSTAQNVAIAALAGVVIIGGAAYVEKDKLGMSSGGIHSVDFRNSPVEVVGTACADAQLTTAGVATLPLHDGAYQLGQYQFELVGDVRYGDVSGHTGDNTSEKAVFVGSCSNSGKTSQVLFVYGMMDGKPERLATSDLSQSGNALVQSYSVGEGAIQVKANQGDPPALVTLTYALLNGSLVNLNPPAAPQPVPAVANNQTDTTPDADSASAPMQNASASMTDDKIDFQTFHDTLSPYGEWIRHPRWGLVWHPTQVDADFRPYRNGHWEDSDEYGTVWVSDDSWGDIPSHYGRWGYDPDNGWLWQPGYTWSPAWVAWREGAGNIGWFPIPPDYYDGTGPFIDDWDGWYGYRGLYGAALDAAAFYALWSFIPADDIFAPGLSVDFIDPARVRGFIGRTAGWTRFGTARGHLVDRAIDGERFRSAFGHPLPAGTRHDFASHHGPIVGPARGRQIAAHERLSAASHMAGARHVSSHAMASHFGPGLHHSSFGHASASTHHFGATHGSSGFAERSGSETEHSGFGGRRSGSRGETVAEHSGFGGAQHSGFGGAQRSEHSGFGGAQRSGFGGGAEAQRGGFGGGASAERPAFGGGAVQRPAFGGGAVQRPAFGGGGMQSRPAFGGGGVSRPAAPIQRSSKDHR
ncbi:MAG TPA: DUF6600 domain-containing protein [Rhizomicrobium sp.]|jgi:hypothetical protein